VLAGIGQGVAGGIFVLLFLMLGSLWYRRSMWIPVNLFATVVYGPEAYTNHFASTSWAGLALVLVMYGVAGALWGLVWRDRRPRHLLLYGAICGAITTCYANETSPVRFKSAGADFLSVDLRTMHNWMKIFPVES